ncbi:MAG TPA: hypothetical protein VJ836_02865 [Candidatus Saccharimonadales bacterium]|nr:hypothetical protein [Candidatus Saccharimonadales bacterium]
MMLFALFSWWYTAGWAGVAKKVGDRVESMLETFSVYLLARTLFAPFRQISAGQVSGSFDVRLRAFGDRAFSRVFGAFIRSIFIIMGAIAALLAMLLGLVQVAVWPFIPLLPLAGLVLAMSGWIP